MKIIYADTLDCERDVRHVFSWHIVNDALVVEVLENVIDHFAVNACCQSYVTFLNESVLAE